MSRAADYLAVHGFAVGLLLVGALLALYGLRRSALLRLVGSALVVTGLGGLVLSTTLGFWVLATASVVLVGKLLTVYLSGRWSAQLGYLTAAALFAGLGGFVTIASGEFLADVARATLTLDVAQPRWLLLLLVLPLIVRLSFRSLAGLGPARRVVAIALRCSLLLLLTLALAEVRLTHSSETVTVLFVVDRSYSVPEENDPQATKLADLRWERIKRFVNSAVERRGKGHERDQAGLILFGRRPRLELPPASIPRLGFTEIGGNIDGSYTDVAAALKLALASFPEGSGKRIVLLSDGNENLGKAEEQAQLARRNGVEIDTVALAAGRRNESEVLVQAVEAPPRVEQGAQLPIRVLVRNHNRHPVLGTLTLKQVIDGATMDVPPSPLRGVKLEPGPNVFTFKQPTGGEEQSLSYEAEFRPEVVLAGRDRRRIQPGEDRVQNNRAMAHVIARGQSRILLLESKEGEHQYLADMLRTAGEGKKFVVHTRLIDQLPQAKGALGVFLSRYDCVILANVPAAEVGDGVLPDRLVGVLSADQMEMLRSNTHDQGCGLVMIGGPYGFGAGGWQGTPVEKALPVDCNIKSLEVSGKSGLVLVMHASEIAEGNGRQKEVAKIAISKMAPMDMVGMTYYGGLGGHVWHIPFQEVGERRTRLLKLVDTMQPGDMPDCDPALQMAYDALTNPAHNLATKLIIFISDGDHWNANPALLAKLKAANIPCTTVCITSHGQLEVQKMGAVAQATGGRAYVPKSAEQLPAIYMKETRLLSQSFLYDKGFQPTLRFKSGPTDGLPDPLRPLYGYVRTTPKPSPLVEVPILARQREQDFPILAYWPYGLGRAVAFTSDARTQPGKRFWDRDWADSAMYSKFWEQVVGWALRPRESDRMSMTAELRDGKVRVVVEARQKDDRNRPDSTLRLTGRVTTPAGKDDAARPPLEFKLTNAGTYEAEFPAEEAGNYFVNATAIRVVEEVKDGKKVVREEVLDAVRGGVTIPYSPEFADLESNPTLLERLREATGGRSYTEDDAALDEAAASGSVFRPAPVASRRLQPIWHWLLCAAGLLLFFDVAVRRVAVDPVAVFAVAARSWEKLRGRASAATAAPQFLDRLRTRKERVAEQLERERASRRFEAEEGTPAAPLPSAEAPPEPRTPTAPPPKPSTPTIAPQREDQPQDYASRLLRAKKRIQDERDKGKNS